MFGFAAYAYGHIARTVGDKCSSYWSVTAQKELGITVANDFLPLVIRIAVLHLGQILKDAGNAEIPASDYTDFLIQFQDSSGVGKLISQYMYSNRQFSIFPIGVCITDQFDKYEGHKQGR